MGGQLFFLEDRTGVISKSHGPQDSRSLCLNMTEIANQKAKQSRYTPWWRLGGEEV
jgi:hypothetical protein